MARPVTLWELILPEDEPEEHFLEFYARISTYAMPLAFAISYARNRDIKWAAIHSFFGVPYLAYVAVDIAGGRSYLGLGETDPVLDFTELTEMLVPTEEVLEPIRLDEPLNLTKGPWT